MAYTVCVKGLSEKMRVPVLSSCAFTVSYLCVGGGGTFQRRFVVVY